MTRKIALSIAPATETTCGDGSGKFCPFVRSGNFGTQWFCAAFYDSADRFGMVELHENRPDGWLMRHKECRDSEIERWSDE